jgi:hypothetical protein
MSSIEFPAPTGLDNGDLPPEFTRQAACRPRVKLLSYGAITLASGQRHRRPIWEKVTVGPERHAEISMTELPLHHQRVGALSDHHRDAGVPERVGCDPDEASLSYRLIPESSSEVAVIEDASAR